MSPASTRMDGPIRSSLEAGVPVPSKVTLKEDIMMNYCEERLKSSIRMDYFPVISFTIFTPNSLISYIDGKPRTK